MRVGLWEIHVLWVQNEKMGDIVRLQLHLTKKNNKFPNKFTLILVY